MNSATNATDVSSEVTIAPDSAMTVGRISSGRISGGHGEQRGQAADTRCDCQREAPGRSCAEPLPRQTGKNGLAETVVDERRLRDT
jgi:hypothetical protein